MANELRIYQDLLAGRINDNPLTSGATTLNSPALAAMQAVGPTQHMMLVLDPDGVGGGAPEIVMVTAHTASTTTCTIARGQLGSTARQHPNGTDWVHGPLASDMATTPLSVLSPSSDTSIDSQSPTGNNDAGTTINIGSSWASTSFCRRALFTFDISALAGLSVKSARLRLVRDGGTGGAVGVVLRAREMLRAYVPNEVTWNVYSTGNNWTTAGAKGTGTDIGAEFYGHSTVDNDTALAEQMIDLTFLLRKRITAGDTTFRFILGTDASEADNSITFHSLEATNPDYRPIMYVEV